MKSAAKAIKGVAPVARASGGGAKPQPVSGNKKVLAEKMGLEHEPHLQVEHQPLFKYPNHMIGLFEGSKPFSNGAYGQEKHEGKKA